MISLIRDEPRLAHAPVRDLEDHLLGTVQDVPHRIFGVVGLGHDLGPVMDQKTQDVFFLDDAGIMGNIGSGRDDVGQGRQITGPADLFKGAFIPELFDQRDQIDGLALVIKLDDGREYPFVRVLIKIFR